MNSITNMYTLHVKLHSHGEHNIALGWASTYVGMYIDSLQEAASRNVVHVRWEH